MRIRITTAAVVAVLAFTAVGCGSDGDGDGEAGANGAAGTVRSSAPASPSAAADGAGGAEPGASASEGSGLPPEPSGAARDAVLAVVRDVHGGLVRDEDKAIDAARNQCSTLDGGGKDADHSAAQRFSYDGVKLTDDDGKHLNYGLRKTLCPAA